MELEMGQSTNKIARRFFLFIAFVFLLILYSVTFNIFDANTPGVWNNCVEGKKEPALFTYGSPITTKDTAKEVLENHFDKEQVFIRNSIEECGTAYLFSSDEGKHIICEDGSIYEYGLICKNASIMVRGEQYFETLKNTS